MGDESGGRELRTTTQITVFNQTYRVTSADGGERAARVARFVDSRMRESASQITTHDVARIAVLTALQIADELLTLKAMYKGEEEASAAPDEDVGDDGPSGGGSEASATPRGTWFESIFDSEAAPPESRGERMGSRLSERLRTARQSETELDGRSDEFEIGRD